MPNAFTHGRFTSGATSCLTPTCRVRSANITVAAYLSTPSRRVTTRSAAHHPNNPQTPGLLTPPIIGHRSSASTSYVLTGSSPHRLRVLHVDPTHATARTRSHKQGKPRTLTQATTPLTRAVHIRSSCANSLTQGTSRLLPVDEALAASDDGDLCLHAGVELAELDTDCAAPYTDRTWMSEPAVLHGGGPSTAT
jgi:hypothetical protein